MTRAPIVFSSDCCASLIESTADGKYLCKRCKNLCKRAEFWAFVPHLGEWLQVVEIGSPDMVMLRYPNPEWYPDPDWFKFREDQIVLDRFALAVYRKLVSGRV